MSKHWKRFAAVVVSLTMAFQFCVNDFYAYAETGTPQTDSVEETNADQPQTTAEPEASTEPAPEAETDTADPAQTPAEDTASEQESQDSDPAQGQAPVNEEEQPQEQEEAASTLKLEFKDEAGTTLKTVDPIALTGKTVGQPIRLTEVGVDTNIQGYTLVDIKDKNDSTKDYNANSVEFTLTKNVTELQLVYRANPKEPETTPTENDTNTTEDSQQGEAEEDSEADPDEDGQPSTLVINYVTRNDKMEKTAIEGQNPVTVEGQEGDIVSLNEYKINIEGYKLAEESKGLVDVTLVAGENQLDLVYEKSALNAKAFTALLADEPAVTYNITYNSNYPSDAKKYDSKNGSSETTLVDAVNTNAVYTYASGTKATVIEGFNLANATFTGWNTKADGTGTAYSPNQEIDVTQNVVLYAQWTQPTQSNEIDLEVRYYYRNNNYVTINVKGLDLGNNTASFMLANLQDVLAQVGDRQHNYDVDHFSGWTVNGQSYGLNETCTTLYKTEREWDWGWKTINYVEVRADDNSKETTAQFFVLNINLSTGTGDKEDYYSVGSGTLVDNLPEGQIGSDNNTGRDVSEYIKSAPSPAQIADILSISLEEAQSVRWYVIKDQSDGYHVDGIIYNVNVNWNVTFIGTAGSGTEVRVVEDNGSLEYSNFPTPANEDLFRGWFIVDENGDITDQQVTGNLNRIQENITLQAVYYDAYAVTGSFAMEDGSEVIDGVSVDPGTQTIKKGGKSEEIKFTVPEGYTISNVTLNNNPVSDWKNNVKQSNDGTLTYTHPVINNVKESKNIVVTLSEKPDRQDYDDGLIKVEDNTDDELDEINQGSIIVNVYVDGQLRADDTHTVKFAYADGAMVDVDVTLYGEDANKYVINKVYAEQSNPQLGNNYIEVDGGKLDNVIDGSTVSIYLTSKYSVEYYLDGQKLNGDYLDNTVYTYEAVTEGEATYYPAEEIAKSITVKALPEVGDDQYVSGMDIRF